MVLYHFVLCIFVLQCSKKVECKAVSPNGNPIMHYYILPMSDWEAESIQRQSRQQEGAGNNGSPLPPAGTAINVANILTGLFREDVRPILSGSTAFIPPGDLRVGVTGLLQGLAPALQRILFGDGSVIPTTDYTIPTAAPVPRTDPPTSPRPRIRRTTTGVPISSSPGETPEEGSEEETEAPTDLSSSPLPLSSTLVPTTASAESDEETEPPEATNAPSSTAATVSVPESPPLTEKAVAATPESPQSQNQPNNVPNQPVSASPESQVSSNSSATQLKVVLEDANSIVTANVVSNATGEEKQYIYLVLLPDQYEQFNRLTAVTQRQDNEQATEFTNTNIHEADTEAETVSPFMQTAQQEVAKVSDLEPSTATPITVTSSTSTNRNIRYKYRIKNGTTTIPPPHLQLQFYRLTSTTTSTTTTTTAKTTSTTDLPGVKGFENEDDELEN